MTNTLICLGAYAIVSALVYFLTRDLARVSGVPIARGDVFRPAICWPWIVVFIVSEAVAAWIVRKEQEYLSRLAKGEGQGGNH